MSTRAQKFTESKITKKYEKKKAYTETMKQEFQAHLKSGMNFPMKSGK